jgi:hypothetical protein
MSRSRKLLILGGLGLAAIGMLYGLHYAVFIEHQMLDRLGGSLAEAFVDSAQGNGDGATMALTGYANTKYHYVRQVDVHSHWIGLAMLMIVLGVTFDRSNFSEHVRWYLSIAMLIGSFIFPLGVILQTVNHLGLLASGLAVLGAALVTISLAAAAWGFTRLTS